jgi:hypothetical protein
MTEPRIEMASAQRSGLSAYAALALRAGVSLRKVVSLAEENRLGELFDTSGQLTGGSHAKLEYLEDCRNTSARKRLSPAAALGILRARRFIWDAEEVQ